MISLFKSPQDKKELEELFQIELDELPLIYECLNIETSFGNTSVLVAGKEDKPPLVFIYGVNGCPPFALETFIKLMDDFRFFAINGLNQLTLNAENILSVQDESYGQWMYEVLAWLNIRNAILLGISFGGFICLKTLLFDERHVAKAILIGPAGITNRGLWRISWNIWLPLKLYQWLKHPCLVRQLSKELFTDQNEAGMALFPKWVFHSEMSFSPFPLIKKEEAQKIKTPIYMVAAEKDVLFPGLKILKRAKAIFPSLCEVLLLKNSRHIPDQSGNEQIVEFIRNLTR
jgi:pimeloyl-ACP methyl ester carboxylesterase